MNDSENVGRGGRWANASTQWLYSWKNISKVWKI